MIFQNKPYRRVKTLLIYLARTCRNSLIFLKLLRYNEKTLKNTCIFAMLNHQKNQKQSFQIWFWSTGASYDEIQLIQPVVDLYNMSRETTFVRILFTKSYYRVRHGFTNTHNQNVKIVNICCFLVFRLDNPFWPLKLIQTPNHLC